MNIEEKKIFLIEDGVALTRNFFLLALFRA